MTPAPANSSAGSRSLDTLEEVFYLVRQAPGRALAAYYFGAIPFVLALLYFWADMSKNAFALAHLLPGSLALAGLFLWMKAWHVLYARELRAELFREPPPAWSLAGFFRLLLRQAALQPSGLFALPLALFAVLPFGSVYAWYQNLTALDDGRLELRRLASRAAQLARFNPRENLLLIWIFSPVLLIFTAAIFLVIVPVFSALTPDWTGPLLGLMSGLVLLALMPLSPFGIAVAANFAALILILPQLLLSLLGIPTAWAGHPMGMLNSTFFAVVCGLTYLCLDPLLKAAYVLRCFHAQSRRTGEDLQIELKRLTARNGGAKAAALLLLLSASLLLPLSARSRTDTALPAPTVRSVSAADLNQALDRELQNSQYAWRMPRVPRSELQETWLERVFKEFSQALSEVAEKTWKWLRKIYEWLKDWWPESNDESAAEPNLDRLSEPLQLVLYLLLAVILSVAGVMLYRMWKRREAPPPATAAAVAVSPRPDPAAEDARADEFPEDAWLKLARELIEKGEFRLALRAIFLASLSHLAEAGWISVARFKSNRDYREELARRAHAAPEVLEIFSRSVTIYESVWYGLHPATRELLVQVWANQQRLQTRGPE